MEAAKAEHPAPEQLRAFALGQLEPAVRAEVERHVAGCAFCGQALRQIPDDTFGQQLRESEVEPPTVGLPPPPVPSLGIPQELVDHPRYRIVSRLGEGGMGTVFKAEHRIMERTVALKVIASHLVSNPNAVGRFHQEVKAAARLSHPNIVAAHDADQAGNLHFLVMEFVEGANLARLVDKKGPLAVVHAASFARQTALGLQHAHEHGMIHRDIKPHNLMVTRKGQVKILDFGVARFATTRTPTDPKATDRALTSVDVVIGTPDFLSPEQARDSHAVDGRADLYSLGCTVYYLLTGKVPFPGGSAVQKLFAQCEQEAEPLEKLRPDVPVEMARVVRKLMAKKPEDRYQSAAEAAAALLPFTRQGAALAGQAAQEPVEVFPLPDEPVEVFPLPDEAAARTGILEETPPLTGKLRKPARISRRAKWILVGVGVVLMLLALAQRGPQYAGGAHPRVLYVLAPRDFFYPEYASVVEKLKKEGVEVQVASTSMNPAVPVLFGKGEPVKPDLLLSEADPVKFDAVILCGGPGPMKEFAENDSGARVLANLLQAMEKAGKPIGAIGHGPLVLVNSGTKVREVTCDPSIMEMAGRKARVLRQPLVVDGLFITGRFDSDAPVFVESLLSALRKKR